MIRPAAALLLIAAAIAGLAALLMPTPAQAMHATAPATHAVHADGVAVSSVLDEQTADAAFLADLFDGAATDLTPAQAADLIATAHRICDLPQTRADWLASLTVGPHPLTADEAGKLYDTAEAAFCPAKLAATYGAARG